MQASNLKILEEYKENPPTVEIIKVAAVEADEMWSFVGSKKNQRWLWHAIDHMTGQVLAYVLGKHTDEILLKLKSLLAPFGVVHYYTDGWGGYERHIPQDQLSIGKSNTQRIERNTSL